MTETEKDILAILQEVCEGELGNIQIKEYIPNVSITFTGEYFGDPIEKTINLGI